MQPKPIVAPRVRIALTLACLVWLLGCGPGGPKTFPVTGKLELNGGDVQPLAGSTLEAAQVSDPTIRAAGTIQADGSFTLESRHEGIRLNGAQAGKYEVRIILSDDDRETHRRAVRTIAPRFLDFKESGLSFDVPTSGPITLPIAPR